MYQLHVHVLCIYSDYTRDYTERQCIVPDYTHETYRYMYMYVIVCGKSKHFHFMQ